jgi:2-methylisocitrate lyase-like PEP mutase family enzyme
MRTIEQRRADFRALHQQGCFVIPNPWDIGTARMLAGLGFKALASTSSGFAWSRGAADYRMTREAVLAHLRELVAATDLPVNADFESGYADTPEGVAESVRMAIDTGVAGLSIEDSTGLDHGDPIRPLDEAVARMRAARRAIDESRSGVMLVGRCENFWLGKPELEDTIRRLKAYSEAGADCLYAPLVKTESDIRAIVQAVAPKPVNLLISGESPFTMSQVAAMGVRRVSVGGALARAAWGGFRRAARTLAKDGRFDGFAGAAPGKELNDFFEGRGAPKG